MKAQSTIEKKEREYEREAMLLVKRWGTLAPWEIVRHKYLEDFSDALRWVLGKDDDETCLTQGENKSTNPLDSPLHSRADGR